MIAEARKKAAERQATIRYEEADAEQLPFAAASFDIAVSRHLLWTLPHPERAMDEWIRVLRAGGSSSSTARLMSAPCRSRSTTLAGAPIGDRLPFVSGWPREEIERLFAAHQLVNIASDPFLDLVAAEEQRMQEEGLERRIRRRYAVWGDVPR